MVKVNIVRSSVTNTQKQAEDNPLRVLTSLMADGSIEAQEHQGQQELVNSDVLPVIGLSEYKPDGKYASLGFVIGELVQDDPLFCYVQLPAGWTKRAAEHDMWSYLYDDKGRRRIGIFYKAAYYDRHASINTPGQRYGIAYGNRFRSPTKEADGLCEHVVTDAATPVRIRQLGSPWPEWIVNPDCVIFSIAEKWTSPDTYYKQSEEVENKCVKWLDENFPDHKNPLAYWD